MFDHFIPDYFMVNPEDVNTCIASVNGVSEIQLKVRDYELDRYEVVNNAVYCSYCHLGMYFYLLFSSFLK